VVRLHRTHREDRRGAGFPRERITVVNNAIDTTEMRRQVASVPEEVRSRLRGELFGADVADALVGLYCGRLYHLRRIPFLLAACDAIHARTPAFRMVVVGVGPDADMVRAFAESRPWFRYVGEKYAADLAPYLRAADLFLMPGMLGLNILDAFAAGLPVFTTDCGIHSPEVEYLEKGVNGVMTAPEVEPYAAAILDVIERRSLLTQMKTGALRTSERFSAPAMARAFADGIAACLRHGGRPAIGDPRQSAA
jgi:glycosyltransferase involved in cell wall biosynthesis